MPRFSGLAGNAAQSGGGSGAPNLGQATGTLGTSHGGTSLSASSLADLRQQMGIGGAGSGSSTDSGILPLITHADAQPENHIGRFNSGTSSLPVSGATDGVLFKTGDGQFAAVLDGTGAGNTYYRTHTATLGSWGALSDHSVSDIADIAALRTLAATGIGQTTSSALLPQGAQRAILSRVGGSDAYGSYFIAVVPGSGGAGQSPVWWWQERPVGDTFSAADIKAGWKLADWWSPVGRGVEYDDFTHIPEGDAGIVPDIAFTDSVTRTSIVVHTVSGTTSSYVAFSYDGNDVQTATITRSYTLGGWAETVANPYSGAGEITAPADDDKVLIADKSDSDSRKYMDVADFARHNDNISANAFRTAYEQYTFKTGSAIPASGEISWATGSTNFLIYPKSGDVSDFPQEFADGEEIRFVQRDDTSKQASGVVNGAPQQSGNYWQVSVHNIIYGSGGAPDGDASVDIRSVGSLVSKQNIFQVGDSWADKGNVSVVSADWARRIIELEADRIGGIPAGRFVTYTRGTLTGTSTLAQIQAQAVSANLLNGSSGRNNLWIGSTTSVSLPPRDNYAMYGVLRCTVHQDISYLEVRLPHSDDRTVIEFWKRDESGNSIVYTRLQAHSSSAGTDTATNVELAANNGNDTYTGHLVDNANANSDVLHAGDVLELRWGFVELSGGERTELDYRLATSGFYSPILNEGGAIRLSPTGMDADYVRLFS